MQPNNVPNPDYEFILKDSPPQKRSLMPKMPKLILLIVGAFISMLVLILIYGLFFSGRSSGSVDNLIGVMGRAQEISRISKEQQPKLKDPTIITLAATVGATTQSDKIQISNYLTKAGEKVDPKNLLLYTTNNKDTDSKLEQAAVNNTLDSVYASYLKTALNEYSGNVKTAYSNSDSVATKEILKKIFDSTQTLLQQY